MGLATSRSSALSKATLTLSTNLYTIIHQSFGIFRLFSFTGYTQLPFSILPFVVLVSYLARIITFVMFTFYYFYFYF